MNTSPDTLNKNLKAEFFSLLLSALGIWVFAILVQRPEPLKWFALPLLFSVILLIARQLNSVQEIKTVFGIKWNKKAFWITILAVIIGILVGSYHNHACERSFFPSTLTWFALVSASIGITEELVFRGFIQGKASEMNACFGVIFAAFAHAFYKFLLFIYPQEIYNYNLWYLLGATFVMGILMGYARQKTKSIYPALLGHAMFDIVVYGELTEAPWWVF